MGLFDSFAKQLVAGAAAGKIDPVADILGGLLNQVGGLDGLMTNARAVGLERAVASWIGSGSNEGVTPLQVENLLGQNVIQAAAQRLGFNASQMMPLLAQFLPQIIDTLTPNGRVDQGANSADGLDLGGAVAAVLGNNAGGLGGFLGGLFGGGSKPA